MSGQRRELKGRIQRHVTAWRPFGANSRHRTAWRPFEAEISPRRGSNTPAQGTAKSRRAGISRAAPPWVSMIATPSPERATQRTCSEQVLFRPFRALLRNDPVFPGRRCALPWADLFGLLRGEFCGGWFGTSCVPPLQFTALPAYAHAFFQKKKHGIDAYLNGRFRVYSGME